MDWISDVLPGGDEGHADEKDDEGCPVVQLERKVVDRSWIRLSGRRVKVNLSTSDKKVKVRTSDQKVKVNLGTTTD